MPSSRSRHAGSVLLYLTLVYACGGDGPNGDVTTPDTQAPAVNLSAPSGLLSGTVTLHADASDDREVSGVRFQADGNHLDQDTEAPYEHSWNTIGAANGAHTLTAIAEDAAGNSTTSAPVSVTVSNVVPTGSIHVAVVTSGPGSYPAGYTVLVDGASKVAVEKNGAVDIADVPVGQHSVGLGGVLEFCAVGQPVQFAEVLEGAVFSLNFTIVCSLAPTGQIMFQAFTYQGQLQVVTVNPDGSNAAVVLTDAGEPAWSHDRQRIAFLRDENLYIAKDNGSGLVQLTNTPGSESEVRWSPDDSRLLYHRRTGTASDIFVVGDDGAGARPIFRTPGQRNSPDWSPDGRRIVYTVADVDLASLWIANADGSAARRLTSDGANVSPAWSPDGKQIAYRHQDVPGEQTEIYVIPAAGGTPLNLTQNPAFEFDPEWSPDGQWIAFIAERNAAQALWIMRADGSDARLVSSRASFQFTSSPSWR